MGNEGFDVLFRCVDEDYTMNLKIQEIQSINHGAATDSCAP
ncbi:hypothetical protein [Streptomyces sp. NPDC047525]